MRIQSVVTITRDHILRPRSVVTGGRILKDTESVITLIELGKPLYYVHYSNEIGQDDGLGSTSAGNRRLPLPATCLAHVEIAVDIRRN